MRLLWLALLAPLACDYDWDHPPNLGSGGGGGAGGACMSCRDVTETCADGHCALNVCEESAPALTALTNCVCPLCQEECGDVCGQPGEYPEACTACVNQAASGTCAGELDTCVNN